MPELNYSLSRYYLQNASVEVPGAPALFLSSTPLEAQFSARRQHKLLSTEPGQDGVTVSNYEVSVALELHAKSSGASQYLVDVMIGGLFHLTGFDEAQANDFLSRFAPSMLAPALRMQMADMLTRATLPVFFMPDINWAELGAEDNVS